MTGERRPLIAANWKMNKTNAEAAAFCDDFTARDLPAGADVVHLPAVHRAAHGGRGRRRLGGASGGAEHARGGRGRVHR